MVSSSNKKKAVKDPIELIIPDQLLNTLSCLKESSAGDVSRDYSITLKSIRNKELFVDNEEDLRDVLQDYLNYRKCQRKIEQNMQTTDKNTKRIKVQDKKGPKSQTNLVKKSTKITRVEYYVTPDGSQTSLFQKSTNEPCCSHTCSAQPEVTPKKKKRCCEIL